MKGGKDWSGVKNSGSGAELNSYHEQDQDRALLRDSRKMRCV